MNNARDAYPDRESEQGIALIIVLVVLMFTSILALELKSTAALHMRLATNKRDDFLMREGMRGQLEVLKQVLLYDLKENDIEALDDIWTEEKYTRFQEGQTGEGEDERDPEEPVSSQEFELTARVEDESRKFNLHNLLAENEEVQKHWYRIFKRLLVNYRADHAGYDLSTGDADQLIEALKEWLSRKDDDNRIPKPRTGDKLKVMVTPDELLMVPGFTREMFYDQRSDVEDEEAEVVPGLYRYLTLWSEGPINMNTADPILIKSMFEEKDESLVEDFIDWRDSEAEPEEGEEVDPDAEPKKNALKNLADLGKIEGFEAEVLQRNRLDGTVVGFRSTRFSIHLSGKGSNGFRRQERYVLERAEKGFTTLLAEERNDPDFEDLEEEDS